MGLGVLEDRKLEHVPGTAYVLDDEARQHEENSIIDPNLKYDRSGAHPIILVPQPSDDPNDPLNWPLWKRDLILFTLSLLSVIAASLSPLLAANTLTLALHFGRTFTDMALLTGYHLLGVGVAGFLFVPSARVWGKRHTFIIGTIFIIFSSAWGGASGSNYTSLLWARIFQGIGLAPFEALVNATVGDLYYVHERGKRMALTNFAVFGGAFFTPVVVGRITHALGWPWTFYFVAIFTGALLPVVLLFVPETAYPRDNSLETDTLLNDSTYKRQMDTLKATNEESDPVNTATSKEMDVSGDTQRPSTADNDNPDKPLPSSDVQHLHTTAPSGSPTKQTLLQRLAPFNGRKTNDNYFKLLLRPFALFLHPGILWACLIQGTLIGWTVFIGIVLAAIMLGPPLFFNEVQTGYMYTGAFIGAVVGFLLAGLLADSVPAFMTRRNRGVYEPEFRLILVIPQLVLGCCGLYGFGITSDNTFRYGWFWPDFFFAFEVAGMVVGAVSSALYIVDAHRNIAIEAFTCLLVFKNIFSFGLTWSGYNWLVEHGIKHIFIVLGSVQVAVCALTILMYVFGKRNRSFFARHDILKLTQL
ncbi:MFS general substrate transporter [Rhizodiscina lignyota]|uniref:MFS general substrate transporter n=1 Tax=Rhizodiscina lignyota TaxID=1504668 RepID=A0A9P4IJ65_9PEZI|nr:MFS general substrate transporter [Rhizodiscina lignyota]